MFELIELATVCDQFIFFFKIELKFKSRRKAFRVELYRLIERFGGHPVKRGQVSVHQHWRGSQRHDQAADLVVRRDSH